MGKGIAEGQEAIDNTANILVLLNAIVQLQKTTNGFVPLREGLTRSLDYFRAAVDAEKAQPRLRDAAAQQGEEYFRLASGR